MTKNTSGAQNLRGTALMRAIADAIHAEPVAYNQKSWGVWGRRPSCDTPACIAGWAVHLAGESDPTRVRDNVDRAREVLRLTEEEADELFGGYLNPSWFAGAFGIKENEVWTILTTHQTPPANGVARLLRYLADQRDGVA